MAFLEALLASPHISALSEGVFGTVASYLPGRRIPGLRVLPDGRLEVHVVMAWGSTVDDVEASLLRTFEDPGELAHLVIEDIAAPPSEPGPALRPELATRNEEVDDAVACGGGARCRARCESRGRAGCVPTARTRASP